MLIALDADGLDRAVGAWLRERAAFDQARCAIALDRKDPRGSWDDEGRLVLFSAITHRADGQDAVGLRQITVPEDTTETTQMRTLLEIDGHRRSAGDPDAAHTCADTARYLVEGCKADSLMTIKGSRPSLRAAALAVLRELGVIWPRESRRIPLEARGVDASR